MPEFRIARVNSKFFAEWYDEDGKRHRRSLGTSDRQIAQPAFVEFKRAFTFAVKGTPVTVGAIYEEYRKDRGEAGKGAVTRIADAWKRLSPAFGSLMPHQINEGLCRDYLRDRLASGASAGTVHIELGYLRAAMRFAHTKRNWIDREPYIPLPQKPPPKDHYLTKAEARRLLAAAVMPHVRLFIVLALTTAARAGAVLDLTWNRVDLDRRVIRLGNPERALTNKGRATVPINDMAYEALSGAKPAAISPYVIEWGGEKVASVKKAISRTAERAGLECSPHVLRHTAAVWMAEAGVPMEEIAQYLGHSNIDTTRRIYARFSPDHLRHAAKALQL